MKDEDKIKLINTIQTSLRNYIGINPAGKTAVQLKQSDYDKYDYLIGMERNNVMNMVRMCGGDPEGKISKLLDFADAPRDIADPWYTGDFDRTYNDIVEGCFAFLNSIQLTEN